MAYLPASGGNSFPTLEEKMDSDGKSVYVGNVSSCRSRDITSYLSSNTQFIVLTDFAKGRLPSDC